MTTENKSQYELFHEWLNDCPISIEDYEDNIDSVTIRFETLFEDESNNETSEIAPERDTKTPENKVDPLTHKVMYNRELNVIEASEDDYNFVEHTSECS